MIGSLYYSSWKIPERCENSFMDLRIDYEKLCYFNEANHDRNETQFIFIKELQIVF